MTSSDACRLIIEKDAGLEVQGKVRDFVCSTLNEIEEFFEVQRGSTNGVIKFVSDVNYFIKHRAPSWSNAFFVNGLILIPYSTYKSQTFSRAVRHELTHLVIYRNFGSKIPEWLDEGLALYMEGPINKELEKYFEMWKRNPNRLPIKTLTVGMANLSHKDALQAYSVSYYAVQLLLKGKRKKMLLEFLRNTHSNLHTKDIERALLNIKTTKLETDF